MAHASIKDQTAAPKRATKPLSNEAVILLALFELGGENGFVDCEDIAYRANELAPGRFTWVKYPDQINIHTIKTRLWVAKSERSGSLVTGSDRDGWMLTASGIAAVREFSESQRKMPERKKTIDSDEQWRQNERMRLLASSAFRSFSAADDKSQDGVSNEDAESFFRINAYVVGATREKKIQRIVNAFGKDPELGTLVQILSKRIKHR